MTVKQRLLKAFYPALMWFSRKAVKESSQVSNKNVVPKVSFYSLFASLNNGQQLNFDQFKGKKILLVNTASNCGYTAQYEALEELSKKFQNKLTVIGFPSNDFNEQEKDGDQDIAAFCKINYGVTFPLIQKSEVKRSAGQGSVYQWLTDASKNGWNNKQPEWNFSKYLINENGMLTNYFAPAISPLDKTIISAIGQ